jgi:hypothetical protein
MFGQTTLRKSHRDMCPIMQRLRVVEMTEAAKKPMGRRNHRETQRASRGKSAKNGLLISSVVPPLG